MLFFVFRSRSNYSCPPRGSAVLQKENFDNKSLYYIKSEIFIGIIKSFFYKYMFRIPRNWQNPKPPCKIWKIDEFFKQFKSVNLFTDRHWIYMKLSDFIGYNEKFLVWEVSMSSAADFSQKNSYFPFSHVNLHYTNFLIRTS